MLKNPEISGHPAYSYWARKQSIRTEIHRMILHKDGYAELYDHRSKERKSRWPLFEHSLNNLYLTLMDFIHQLSMARK